MTSSIIHSLVTLTIDGVTSFLQLTDVQNVRNNTRFRPNKSYGRCKHSVQNGGFVIDSEAFVHIFLILLSVRIEIYHTGRDLLLNISLSVGQSQVDKSLALTLMTDLQSNANLFLNSLCKNVIY